MQIKRLAATFGRLENESLDLEPGLNVIEAPNEAGKSTWTALLRVMFYGLNTRDRSPGADKRRYQPWSGSAMNGHRLPCGLSHRCGLRRDPAGRPPGRL